MAARNSGAPSSSVLTKETMQRIQKDISNIMSDPPESMVDLHVHDTNMCIIHFLLRGPPDTPYEKGFYVFKFELPPNYPWAPPKISCESPSGRFEQGKTICATFTHYHPENWSAIQTLSSLVVSLISFMANDYTDDGMHLGYYKAANGSYVRLSSERRSEIATSTLTANIQAGFTRMFPCLTGLLEAKERREMTLTPAPTAAPSGEGDEKEIEGGGQGEGERPAKRLRADHPDEAPGASGQAPAGLTVYKMAYEDSDGSQVSFLSSECPTRETGRQGLQGAGAGKGAGRAGPGERRGEADEGEVEGPVFTPAPPPIVQGAGRRPSPSSE